MGLFDFDMWIGNSENIPNWRKEFNMNLSELEIRTGLSRNKLKEVADAIEKLKIIKI